MKKNLFKIFNTFRGGIILAIVSVLWLPLVVGAAYDSVTVDASGADILLPGNSLTYTLTSATRVESFTVNDSSISFVMLDHSIVEIESTDRSELAYSSGCEVIAQTCTNSKSTLALQCGTSETITITPGAAGTCSGGGSSGSAPGGGGTGGGGGASKPADPNIVNVSLALNKEFTLSLPNSSHTVTVTAATEDMATVIIKSDPIIANLAKNVAQEFDTDKDGTKDLKATYLGLDFNRPKFVFVQLAATTKIEEVGKTQVNTSCSVNVGQAYKRAGSSSVYFITKDCKKRAFNNSRVFFTYFDAWSDVNVTTRATLNSLEDDTLGFMPWGSKYDPKYGALVKIVSDPKVYLLLGTEKYWITDENVFNTLNYKWNWIEDIDESLLDKYTIGSEINYINHHPNFTLVKYDGDPKVYRLEDGKKRHVANQGVFDKLKYRLDRIVTLPDTEQYETGDQITE